MKLFSARFLFFLWISIVLVGCANIMPPQGGKKDTTPPKIKSVSPKDSLLNTRVSLIEMHFNEFVTVSDASKEVQVSPLLPIPLSVLSYGKRVEIKIPDTLLQENTTYRVSMGKAIKDLHEGNPMDPYTYVFSTGNYFDSLKIAGTVYDAMTGLPDADGFVVLYKAEKSDSAIVKEKPSYIAPIGAGGSFELAGLPYHAYRIYALHDANNNLTFDGKKEKVGFIDSIIYPADSAINPVTLRVFEEIDTDTAKLPEGKKTNDRSGAVRKNEPVPFVYSIVLDTSNINKRTFDITRPIDIAFNRRIDTINKQRVFLSFDSSGVSVESEVNVFRDTISNQVLHITAPWKEDAVYTLRLLKGFAKDSAGAEVMPARFSFRTQSDDDYAKLEIHLPGKYRGMDYILMVTSEKDTIYNKVVTDTVVALRKLKPGDFKMRIIVDKNHNGKWDTGNLLEKIQPEYVIPYTDPIQLKAGWSNIVDFEPVKKGRSDTSPKTRDKPPVK